MCPVRRGQSQFWKLSSDFMKDAKAAFLEYKETQNEEKLRQACEKGFGAFAQALMHYKGRELHHSEFGDVADELSIKTRSNEIIRAHWAAESLHASFYHRTLSAREIEDALKQIDLGVRAITESK